MEKRSRKGEYYNGTSNTAAGITTPADQEDETATDMVSGAVEAIMDGLTPDGDGRGEDE